MNHLDLFTGITGFSECAKRAWGEDYNLLAMCEIDRHCHLVERRHRPGVQIIDDVEKCNGRDFEAIDLLTFGWPCQDLSVAGKRAGLAGSKSGLLFEAVRILAETKARWFVAENVPGLLSANERRDMGTAIRLMEELGYCVSWTVLDAQFANLAQRRERVFFVGSLATARSPQVLFESESVCWNPAPSREKGQGVAADVAPSIGASGRGFSRTGESRGQDPVVAVPEVAGCLSIHGHDSSLQCRQAVDAGYIIPEVACALQERDCKGTDSNTKEGHLVPVASPVAPPITGNPYGDHESREGLLAATQYGQDIAGTLTRRHDSSPCSDRGMNVIGFQSKASASQSMNPDVISPTVDKGKAGGTAVAFTLHGAHKTVSTASCTECAGSVRTKPPGSIENSSTMVALQGMQVRRLTVVECHRLQGYPDDWCAWGIDENGKKVKISDTQQYRMLGNAIAINPVEWIMRRLREVDVASH